MFESEHFKKEAGLVTFTPSVSEWVEKTNAAGLYVKRGKYGGTFAHKDIAFEFASAISPGGWLSGSENIIYWFFYDESGLSGKACGNCYHHEVAEYLRTIGKTAVRWKRGQ